MDTNQNTYTENLVYLLNGVRQLMYGTDDMLGVATDVADLLAKIDGVRLNNMNNRLLSALHTLKNGYEQANETNQ